MTDIPFSELLATLAAMAGREDMELQNDYKIGSCDAKLACLAWSIIAPPQTKTSFSLS